MSNVTIGRYEAPAPGYAGWIEGVDDDGNSWITFLDPSGRPALHWAKRDANGGVIGDPISLI